MRQPVRRFIKFIIIIIALGAGMYSQRWAILDWVEELKKASLPEAASYEEVGEVKEVGEVGEVREAEEVEFSVISSERSEPRDLEYAEDLSAPVDNSESLSTSGRDDTVLKEQATPFPASVNLAVPFTPQAPHANWDLLHKEACEEASILMVNAYYQNVPEGRMDPDSVDVDLKKIVEFENALFGYFEDTTAEQTGVLAELHFGASKAEVIENPTIDDIKMHLAAGRPVIVPAAGRLLGNPYFQEPGPIYHMFIIRGYTEAGKFITNDPGTKRGEAFLYDFDTIMNAMHDWNNGNEITEGKKKILIVYP